MKAEPLEVQRQALPTSDDRAIKLKPVSISLRSRFIIWLMRRLLRPMLAWMIRGGFGRIARMQLFMASPVGRNSYGQELDYCVVGKVPGHVVGNLTDTHKTAILYLHGGAFLIPAV